MLPIIESPKYTIKLPSSGKLIEYRPFLVREEKILLMAQESEKNRDMLIAMKDIVKACTFDKVDPNTLTSYDLEFLFLKLRAKSVGETSTIQIKCNECEAYTEVDVNIDEIEMNTEATIDSKIMLNDSVGVNMRHIRVRDLANITDEKKSQADLVVDTVIASIESIFDANGVYLTDDSSKSELLTFVNSLNRKHMKEIETFIAATPKIEVQTKFCCSGCKHDNEVTLSGVRSFFE